MGHVRRAEVRELRLDQLTAANAEEVSALLANERDFYGRHFSAFSSESGIALCLGKAELDRYWGIWIDNRITGFFMLRGFDEGYQRPSFGVYISETFSNRGLAQIALGFVLSWCRVNNIMAIMLKVHPENFSARHIYEKAGFRFLEVCPRTGHNVMEKRWLAV